MPQLSYSEINPICFEQAIAPHIASEINQQPISLAQLNRWWQQVKHHSEVSIIEGAGGWRLPINPHDYLSDFVKQHKFDVIVVVGMKLGCLNHALLTIEAIERDNIKIAGWIANQLEIPMNHYQENLIHLQRAIAAPMLGEVKSHQVFDHNTPLFTL